MKKLIGIILWLPITMICMVGEALIWIGAHAGGIVLPILGVLFILAVFTKNLYGIGIIGVLIILILALLFGVAIVTGKLLSMRDELIENM